MGSAGRCGRGVGRAPDPFVWLVYMRFRIGERTSPSLQQLMECA
jgi:hypothetical protein